LGKLKVFPPISGKGQGCPFSPLLFNTVLETLTKVIRQKERTPILEEVKASLFTGDMIIYVKKND
jgi:hypothetical protein